MNEWNIRDMFDGFRDTFIEISKGHESDTLLIKTEVDMLRNDVLLLQTTISELQISLQTQITDQILTMQVNDGDVLFIRIPDNMPPKRVKDWTEYIGKNIPKPIQIIFVPSGFELTEDMLKLIPKDLVTNELLLAAKL